MAPDPDKTSKWLGVLLPIMQQGGPVLSLFLLGVMLLGGWYLMHALQRQRDVTKDAYERLLLCKEAQATLGQRCYGAGPR